MLTHFIRSTFETRLIPKMMTSPALKSDVSHRPPNSDVTSKGSHVNQPEPENTCRMRLSIGNLNIALKRNACLVDWSAPCRCFRMCFANVGIWESKTIKTISTQKASMLPVPFATARTLAHCQRSHFDGDVIERCPQREQVWRGSSRHVNTVNMCSCEAASVHSPDRQTLTETLKERTTAQETEFLLHYRSHL